MRRSGGIGVALLAVAAAAAIGCDGGDGDGGGGKPAAEQILGGVYAGEWAGTTMQGLEIAFRVEPGGLTWLSLAWEVGDCTWSTDLGFDEPVPIEEGAVSRQIRLADAASASIAIAFGSPRQATGVLGFEVHEVPEAPRCRGSGATTFGAARR